MFFIMEDDYAHDMFIFPMAWLFTPFPSWRIKRNIIFYEGIFNEILNSIQIGDGEAP